MANVQWQISGEYCEACSCDSVCPCPTSGLAARPTKGFCDAGLVFRVDRGQYGGTRLDGLSFAVLLHTPGPMIHGNWTVGLVLDERASKEQRDALTTITDRPGFYTRQEIIDRYASRSGRDLSGIRYYEIFAVFKIAVVIQQIYFRYVQGQTTDRRFATFDTRVAYLARHAARLAENPT